MLAEIPAGSVTRVRLELMHWTGMRPSQMGRLRAEDFRLDEPIPYVAPPRGGEERRIAAVPLVPEGVAAARALHANRARLQALDAATVAGAVDLMLGGATADSSYAAPQRVETTVSQ